MILPEIDSTLYSPLTVELFGAVLLPGIDARPVGVVLVWAIQRC
jgi:hypothetical protein